MSREVHEQVHELVPVCPLDDRHDVLTDQDCWACGLVESLYNIALGKTTMSPEVEAMLVLDECVEWRPK